MFLASTWEELKVACTFNDGAKEAAEYMLQVSAEQSLKTYLEAHERYLHSMASQYDTGHSDGRKEQRKEDAKIIADRDATIADRDATIANRDATIANYKATVSDQNATIAELKAKLAQYE